MHKSNKTIIKLAAESNFARSTWKITLEKQIEKYTPTDSIFSDGESVVIFSSPRYMVEEEGRCDII